MDVSTTDKKYYIFWVWLAIGLYSLTLCFMKCRLFYAMNMGLRDLAIFDQALWHLLNHAELYSSLVGENILGEHTSFILYLIAPLYKLYCGPETLVCVQSLVVGLGALPVYYIAAHVWESQRAGLVWALSYLLLPSTGFLNMDGVIYGFHPDAFLPFFYLSLFLFLSQKRRWLCVLFVLLCLSVKEDAAITVCAIGLYSLIFLREKRLGIFIIALSCIWYAVATGFVIPYFHQAPSKFLSNYRYLGENVLDVMAICLSQPGYIISLMKEHGLIVYCFVLLAPFAFSALFCPEVLCIAAPALCLNLLSDPVQYIVPHSPVSWHIAPLIPCVLVAGIYGMKRVRGLLTTILRPRPSLVSSALLGVVMVTASGAHLFYGVTPLSLSFWGVRVFPLSRYPLQSELFNRSIYQRSAAEDSLPDLQKTIPRTASLSASFFTGAHFAHRNELYWFPQKAAEAEYLLLDIRMQDPHVQDVKNFLDKKQNTHKLIYSKNNMYLYKK